MGLLAKAIRTRLRRADGEGKRYQAPAGWERIASGLEAEASKALNAVPLRAVVTVDWDTRTILVNGKPSQAVNDYAAFEGLDETLDMLASNGRAVTAYRLSPY